MLIDITAPVTCLQEGAPQTAPAATAKLTHAAYTLSRVGYILFRTGQQHSSGALWINMTRMNEDQGGHTVIRIWSVSLHMWC